MKPRTQLTRLLSLVILLSCGCLTVSVYGSTDERVVMRVGPDKAIVTELTDSLRVITGWDDLRFDENGLLKLGATEPRTGSKGARELLQETLGGSNFIVIEDASSRSDVVFCEVSKAKWQRNDGSNPPAYIILVDFRDFQKVIGDKRARAAFNVGWGVLHEMDHILRDSQDSLLPESVGDCEDRINTMRREVGLPERAEYFYRALPHQQDPNLISRFVRLRFSHQSKSNKTREYWLMWDSVLVGNGLEIINSASLP
jgi:hypothetical protein